MCSYWVSFSRRSPHYCPFLIHFLREKLSLSFVSYFNFKIKWTKLLIYLIWYVPHSSSETHSLCIANFAGSGLFLPLPPKDSLLESDHWNAPSCPFVAHSPVVLSRHWNHMGSFKMQPMFRFYPRSIKAESHFRLESEKIFL